MLQLKRITCTTDFMKCKASGEILMYGDFYYQDMDDPSIVIGARYYNNMKKQRKENQFDYTILNNAKSQKEYQDQLQKAEQEYLQSTMLNMPILGQEAENYQKEYDNK